MATATTNKLATGDGRGHAAPHIHAIGQYNAENSTGAIRGDLSDPKSGTRRENEPQSQACD
jgi:hypothetical protein